MSNILKKIGELLGFRRPAHSPMMKMTDMESMAEMQPEPLSADMAVMSGEMRQMPEMKPREHQSNDMTAMLNEMTKMAERKQRKNQSDDMETNSREMGKMTEMKEQKR